MRLRERDAADFDRVDQVDALRAVGDVDRRVQVVQENADDFTEAQRDDREVVPAQPERGRAQQHAEDTSGRRAERQQHPERQMDAEMGRGEQRVEIGAEREERHVAQVEQSREADDDIESQREHDVEQREAQNAYPSAAKRPVSDEGQRQQQQRQREVGGPNDARIAFQFGPARCQVFHSGSLMGVTRKR